MAVLMSSNAGTRGDGRSRRSRWGALLMTLGLMACMPLGESTPEAGGPGPDTASAHLFLEIQSVAGAPLAEPRLRLASGQRLQGDAGGQLFLRNFPGGRQLLQVEAPGFIPTWAAFTLDKNVRAGARLRLLPRGGPVAIFHTRDGVEVVHQGLTVTVPPGPLSDAEGQLIEGEVEMYLVRVDLDDPSQLLAVPGVQQGVILPGERPVNLESMGVVALVFRKRGPEGPAPTLRAGEVSLFARRIGIRGGMPRSVRANGVDGPGGRPGASSRVSARVDLSRQRVPVWRWEPVSGYWVPTGELGSFVDSSPQEDEFDWQIHLDNPPPLFNVALPFWWRSALADPDDPLRGPDPAWVETACLEVRVVANGQPVAGRSVVARGVEYVSVSRAVTDARGVARLEVMRGRKAQVEVGDATSLEVVVRDAGTCQEPREGAAPTRVTLGVPPLLCLPGDALFCAYGGPVQTRDRGACRAARRFCDAEGRAWSATCVGEVLPQAERCDTAEDDNCDGLINEGCTSVCTEGQTRPCYTGLPHTQGVGQCRAGTQTCLPGGRGWSACAGQVLPEAEDCGRPEDENCDGVACQCWPAESQPCYTGPAGTARQGVCRAGVRLCREPGTGWEACTQEVVPQEESCNPDPVDTDCDGELNDTPACVCAPGSSQSCYTGPASTLGVGACLAGTQTCNPSGASWGACVGEVTPQEAEVCGTAQDDDCNGQINDSPPCLWSVTGALVSARSNHTATPLGDGRVLVAGGYSGNAYLATAEVYTPATNTWTSAPSMASSRRFHTATPLNDGRVLIAGGYNGGTLAAAEVYNPVANAWTSVSSMASPRRFHTATPLNNGKVLVAGGYTSGALATAEVYEPAMNTWTSIPTMASPRANHTATLLSDGRVLVTGGFSGGGSPLATAEVYTPATNTWASVASMASPRFGHTATALGDGRVLVTGGFGGALDAAEVYDPGANAWSPVRSMRSPRRNHTATLLGSGQVLVAGGYNGGALATAEVYSPATNAWVAVPAMFSPRYNHTATPLGSGKVLVTGGDSSGGATLNAAEVYAP